MEEEGQFLNGFFGKGGIGMDYASATIGSLPEIINMFSSGAGIPSAKNRDAQIVSTPDGPIMSGFGSELARIRGIRKAGKQAMGGDIMSGVGAGAKIGKVAGPFGAAVGAGVGAITGAITGAFKKRRAKKRAKRAKKNLFEAMDSFNAQNIAAQQNAQSIEEFNQRRLTGSEGQTFGSGLI